MNLPNKKQFLESLDSHILGRYGLGKWRKKVFFSTLINFIPLLKSLIKNSVSKHGIRDLTFVNRTYINIYDTSNEDWIESRVSRQELFRMGKQSLNVNGWFLMKYFCKIYEHLLSHHLENTYLRLIGFLFPLVGVLFRSAVLYLIAPDFSDPQIFSLEEK